MGFQRGFDDLASGLSQLPNLQLRDEDFGELGIRMLKMNGAQMFVGKRIAAAAAVTECFKHARNTSNP